MAEQIHAAVLGLYGAADSGIPTPTMERMRATLRHTKGPSEILMYPDTPHSFHVDYCASFRKTEAEDGWRGSSSTAWRDSGSAFFTAWVGYRESLLWCTPSCCVTWRAFDDPEMSGNYMLDDPIRSSFPRKRKSGV